MEYKIDFSYNNNNIRPIFLAVGLAVLILFKQIYILAHTHTRELQKKETSVKINLVIGKKFVGKN